MGLKQEIRSSILDLYRQQQRIAVLVQEVIQAEVKAVQAGDEDALARAASYFEELSREYMRLEAVRREAKIDWASQGESAVGELELELRQATENLYQDLQQAQDTAKVQVQGLLTALEELQAQHNKVLQGKQTLQVYSEGRAIEPRCIDQHR